MTLAAEEKPEPEKKPDSSVATAEVDTATELSREVYENFKPQTNGQPQVSDQTNALPGQDSLDGILPTLSLTEGNSITRGNTTIKQLADGTKIATTANGEITHYPEGNREYRDEHGTLIGIRAAGGQTIDIANYPAAEGQQTTLTIESHGKQTKITGNFEIDAKTGKIEIKENSTLTIQRADGTSATLNPSKAAADDAKQEVDFNTYEKLSFDPVTGNLTQIVKEGNKPEELIARGYTADGKTITVKDGTKTLDFKIGENKYSINSHGDKILSVLKNGNPVLGEGTSGYDTNSIIKTDPGRSSIVEISPEGNVRTLNLSTGEVAPVQGTEDAPVQAPTDPPANNAPAEAPTDQSTDPQVPPDAPTQPTESPAEAPQDAQTQDAAAQEAAQREAAAKEAAGLAEKVENPFADNSEFTINAKGEFVEKTNYLEIVRDKNNPNKILEVRSANGTVLSKVGEAGVKEIKVDTGKDGSLSTLTATKEGDEKQAIYKDGKTANYKETTEADGSIVRTFENGSQAKFKKETDGSLSLIGMANVHGDANANGTWKGWSAELNASGLKVTINGTVYENLGQNLSYDQTTGIITVKDKNNPDIEYTLRPDGSMTESRKLPASYASDGSANYNFTRNAQGQIAETRMPVRQQEGNKFVLVKNPDGSLAYDTTSFEYNKDNPTELVAIHISSREAGSAEVNDNTATLRKNSPEQVQALGGNWSRYDAQGNAVPVSQDAEGNKKMSLSLADSKGNAISPENLEIRVGENGMLQYRNKTKPDAAWESLGYSEVEQPTDRPTGMPENISMDEVFKHTRVFDLEDGKHGFAANPYGASFNNQKFFQGADRDENGNLRAHFSGQGDTGVIVHGQALYGPDGSIQAATEVFDPSTAPKGVSIILRTADGGTETIPGVAKVDYKLNGEGNNRYYSATYYGLNGQPIATRYTSMDGQLLQTDANTGQPAIDANGNITLAQLGDDYWNKYHRVGFGEHLSEYEQAELDGRKDFASTFAQNAAQYVQEYADYLNAQAQRLSQESANLDDTQKQQLQAQLQQAIQQEMQRLREKHFGAMLKRYDTARAGVYAKLPKPAPAQPGPDEGGCDDGSCYPEEYDDGGCSTCG
jgi:hypothetical protein